MLSMFEELFLVAIDDYKGTVAPSVSDRLRYGLAGALLAELALQEKIRIDKGKLVPSEAPSTIQGIEADALQIITASKKPRPVKHWISALASNKLNRRVAEDLADKHVLTIEKRRFLWVIPYDAYPQQDASAKYWVKQRLRSVALGGINPAPRDLLLLSLVKSCDMLGLVFTRDERKTARKKIDTLVKREPIGDALRAVLEEIDSAAAAVIIAPTANN